MVQGHYSMFKEVLNKKNDYKIAWFVWGFVNAKWWIENEFWLVVHHKSKFPWGVCYQGGSLQILKFKKNVFLADPV